VDADGKDADVKRYGNGTIIYIKPAYHGTEDSAGIRSYAMAHPDFPHETTVDQWFTESQFESYRSLGFYIANQVINDIAVQGALRDYLAPKL
jgi:hydrogenase maturation factor